jgi:YidC/Oxa1 family membrane protein insertase
VSDLNLNWIYIAISWILLRWHDLWSAVLGPSSGLGWVLSIVFLVITVRVILFPVFVKQIKSQRAMQTLQPQVKALQEKYKGDRETLQREMMELYRREKANPLMGCLPIFLQIPVFIGLFHVLRLIDFTKPKNLTAMVHEYYWNVEQFTTAAQAKIFGAPIAAQFGDKAGRLHDLGASSPAAVKTVAAVLIATMVITTYVTQRQMIARTGPAADPQQAMIQKLMLYGVPASLLVSGSLFPIGVVIYWVTTNLFSMGQQFYVLKKMPPVGGVQADKDKVPADAKALAPKPGVKPQNPKKGARPGAPVASAVSTSTTTATATDDEEPTGGEPATPATRPAPAGGTTRSTAANRHPAKARPKKRKGGRR